MIDPFVDHTPGKTSFLRAVGSHKLGWMEGKERRKHQVEWLGDEGWGGDVKQILSKDEILDVPLAMGRDPLMLGLFLCQSGAE